MKRLIVLAASLTTALAMPAYAQVSEISHLSSETGEPRARFSLPKTSADGRFTVFDRLVVDREFEEELSPQTILLFDRASGATSLVATLPKSSPFSSEVADFDISADGRFVVFNSSQADLVPGDTNDEIDIFVKELATGQIRRVSVSSAGEQANGGSRFGALSDDGRYVAFSSSATNLVSGDTNGQDDVFRYDTLTGQTVRISLGAAGEQLQGGSFTPTMSADGNVITFQTSLTRRGSRIPISHVGVRNFQASASTFIRGENGAISANARFVTYTVRSSSFRGEVFVTDLASGRAKRISSALDGGPAGKLNLTSGSGSISADGCRVVYSSNSAKITPGDINREDDFFVRDHCSGRTVIASVGLDCQPLDQPPGSASISRDGQFVALDTFSDGLVSGDGDSNYRDVYLVRPSLPLTFDPALSLDQPGVATCARRASITMPVVVAEAARRQIRYVVTVNKQSGGSRRMVSKRNVVTFAGLAPGSYTTSYEITSTGADGTRTTQPSRAASFDLG